MEKLNNLKIISWEVQDGVYEDEILLVLHIDRLEEYEDLEKQILQLHFDEADGQYIRTYIYDIINDNGYTYSSEGCNYNLRDIDKDIIKECISKNNLPFYI